MNICNNDLIMEFCLYLSISDIFNFSIINKKNYNLIWNNEIFWRKKNLKDFNFCQINENKFVHRLLKKYSEDPQYYYSKSIYENDKYVSKLLKEVFNVYFPCIGIKSKEDENYFGIFSLFNLINLTEIPDYVLDIKSLGILTLTSFSKSMGIRCYAYMEREEITNNIINKLTELDVIYYIGDINTLNNLKYIKQLKIS